MMQKNSSLTVSANLSEIYNQMIIYLLATNDNDIFQMLNSMCFEGFILNSNKIQNGDVLVLANPGSPGKMAIKMERECVMLQAGNMLIINL